jgi:thiol-disulfide isomerase/thioredoxin
LQSIKSNFDSGSTYCLLGKALEANGQKRSAVDAYLEAVVRPSNKDKEANTALERLWKSEKLGNKQQLQQRIEQKLAQTFSAANYVPQLLSHPAPEFELTTLHGERLSSAQLRGKTIILNFWAPWCGACRPELKPLQDFQAKHPELVVATVVDDATDPKDLASVIRERKLTTLRVCKASSEFAEKLNITALPDTLIIDASGNVRMRHLGSIPDVERYFDADLKAIASAPPLKQPPEAANR